jgi:hypothetical protein
MMMDWDRAQLRVNDESRRTLVVQLASHPAFQQRMQETWLLYILLTLRSIWPSRNPISVWLKRQLMPTWVTPPSAATARGFLANAAQSSRVRLSFSLRVIRYTLEPGFVDVVNLTQHAQAVLVRPMSGPPLRDENLCAGKAQRRSLSIGTAPILREAFLWIYIEPY